MFVKFLLSFLLVYLRATGGEVGATSALAPKIGPLGLVRNKNYYFNLLKIILLKILLKSAAMEKSVHVWNW